MTNYRPHQTPDRPLSSRSELPTTPSTLPNSGPRTPNPGPRRTDHRPPTTDHLPIGDLLREWRQRRRMSQMDLALEAEVSTRHLSFVETGRAQPSREMVLLLAERLEIPLRERNALLTAAGFAAMFPERTLSDPALSAARKAMDLVLTGHEPYPALAMDRQWNMVAANRVVGLLLDGVDPALLSPPVNVLRLSLHPGGIAPRIVNFYQWRSHLLSRLRHQIEVTADPDLSDLYREVCSYPVPAARVSESATLEREYADIVVPLQLLTEAGTLSFFSTTTVFGTPVDITLSEIAFEAFYPADEATADLLRRVVG